MELALSPSHSVPGGAPGIPGAPRVPGSPLASLGAPRVPGGAPSGGAPVSWGAPRVPKGASRVLGAPRVPGAPPVSRGALCVLGPGPPRVLGPPPCPPRGTVQGIQLLLTALVFLRLCGGPFGPLYTPWGTPLGYKKP